MVCLTTSLRTAFFLMLLTTAHVNGQQPWKNFRVYENTVPSRAITTIFEDSRGFVWIGGKNGLYRFDGISYLSYHSYFDDTTTLPSNSIADVTQDHQGNLWIATASSGVAKMNIYTGKVKRYTMPTPSAYSVYPVFDILKDEDDVLWFGTGGRGILKYFPETDRFENYIVDSARASGGIERDQNTVRKLAQDPIDKNILWAAGMEGLFRFNKSTKKVEKFEFLINGIKEWRNNCFHCIYVQDLRNIWLGTWAGGLVKFDYVTKKFSHFFANPQAYRQNNLAKNVMVNVIPAGNNHLYVCSLDEGLLYFDITNQRFFPAIEPFRLRGRSSPASAAYKSPDGGIWAVVDDQLLHQHPLYERFSSALRNYRSQRAFNKQGILSSAVFDARNEKYYIAMHRNQSVLEVNKDFSISRLIATPLKNRAASVRKIFFSQDGKLNIVGSENPFLFTLDRSATEFRPLFQNIPKEIENLQLNRTVLHDSLNNRLWFSANDNILFQWNLSNQTIKKFLVEGSRKGSMGNRVRISDLAIDGFGNLWIASNSGIFRLDAKNNKLSRYYPEGPHTTSIASEFINSVAVDEHNRVWIAPQHQGIQIFDPITEKVIGNFSHKRGSYSNHIDDILCDSKGNIWCTSSHGLLMYRSDVERWKLYTTQDGLSHNELTGEIKELANGEILLDARSTILRFHPGRMLQNEAAPKMHITDFKVLGKAFEMDSLPQYRRLISLRYDQNKIDIHFTAVETLYPEQISYFYRLNGLDSVWQQTDVRSISYASLRPGSYRFEVKALNSDGHESTHPAVISFLIKKPFWQTLWFLILSVLAVAALLYLLYRYRINQIMHVQKIKNDISADLHDDIGSRLTNLQLLTQITRRKGSPDKYTLKNLDIIDEEIIASAEALHEIVTNIRSDEQHQNFSVELRRYTSQSFELSQTKLTLDIDEHLDHLRLPAMQKRDIFLCLKEIINNINKYAAAEEVQISMKTNGTQLILQVIDDGQGFDTSAAYNGHGLNNIKKRVRKWQGDLAITSSPGDGTAYHATFKVS